MFLASTSDKIRLVTDTAVTIDVQATWADYASGSVTPGRTNTAISTATTTDIIASPASSTYRACKRLTIRNKDSTSCDVTVIHTDGTTAAELYCTTLGPNSTLQYTEDSGFFTNQNTSNPQPWYGNLYAAYGRCDPQQMLRMATMSGSIAATPTNIGTSVARISYFRPPADITVNKVRYYGVGSTTNVYRIAIYNGDTLARLLTETAFTTTANTWGEIGSSLGLSLVKDQLYFIACSVNATGTTAGVLCMSTTVSTTTGGINLVPKSWPGNLDLDAGYMDGAFAQGTVTTGALPDPFPTVASFTAWTGGMPLFFLDANNS